MKSFLFLFRYGIFLGLKAVGEKTNRNTRVENNVLH
jgi:hypothetical protein